MIEKVNPSHPDKVADRIAGALVDLAYSKVENPKIAVEVLLGHGVVNLIIESSVKILETEAEAIVSRITKRTDLKRFARNGSTRPNTCKQPRRRNPLWRQWYFPRRSTHRGGAYPQQNSPRHL